MATALLSLALIVVGTAQLSRQAATDEAIKGARSTTELLAHSIAEPDMPEGLVDGKAGAKDHYDRRVKDRLLADPAVVRVKIWTREGRIIYSNKPQLIGDTYRLGDEELDVLDGGKTEAETTDLSKRENRYERKYRDLLEVYTRIESPEGVPLLFEVYFKAKAVQRRGQQIFSGFRPVVFPALGLVVLVATGLLWALTRRLRSSAAERERLLRAAVEASDAERVRIARDLHDSVVQDLAGASFAVSALAREPDTSAGTSHELERAGESLRGSLRSLRSLMVEIYPPDLQTGGLQAALHDLLAPATARGIRASSTVEGADDADDADIALAWRVAQEAVRNALRHSEATELSVSVHGDGDRLVLDVRDNGIGFDPTQPAASGHLGLRSMAGLVADSGGTLDITSEPGRGTTVHLELAGGRR